jgi:hypothetical protein
MSHPLLMALFADSSTAAAAARQLQQIGVTREDLSIVALDHHKEEQIAGQIGGSPGSELEDSRAASRLGELSGYILAAIATGLPGTGAIVAAGPLAAEFGEAAGHVAGDLTDTLGKAGLSDREAGDWQRQIERGAILLGVHVRAQKAADVEMALARHSQSRIVHTEWD